MRQAIDSVYEWQIPRVYGGIPTVFGAPYLHDSSEWNGTDLIFVGIPWNAPLNGTRRGIGAANFEGTSLTPHEFRRNSLKYAGYLPELDIDVFQEFSIGDAGDVVVSTADIAMTQKNVVERIQAIVKQGAIPITMGGNSGPGSFSVIEGIRRAKRNNIRVVHFDAHSDCRPVKVESDTRTNPDWGGTWVWRLLHSGEVEGSDYFHFGLRGPRNHPATFRWLSEAGVPRENVVTYAELRSARNNGNISNYLRLLAEHIADGDSEIWVGIDVDVLDLGSNIEFGDECMGPTTSEVAEFLNCLGAAAGRDRTAGISVMAMPPYAQTLHNTMVYLLLYFLAGVSGKQF